MGTQHAHRAVVKKNTSTEMCATRIHATIQRKNTESTENLVNKIRGRLHKHAQQQLK